MEESENQAPSGASPTKKKWYKKIRYWVLIFFLMLAGLSTLIYFQTRDVPMLDLIQLPKEVSQLELDVSGFNVVPNENVQVYRNGFLQKEVKADETGRFKARVDLEGGENAIYVQALRGGEMKRSADYKVTYSSPKNETVQKKELDSKPSQAEPKTTATEKAAEGPVDKITSIVNKIGDDLEVTVWDTKSNPAKNDTPPPYEVIINAGSGDIASCYYAKQTGYEIMKKLYTDDLVKDKISRVKFTSWGQLKTSVGSDDGLKTPWSMNGPTNYWKSMAGIKESQYEKGPLNQRTWGEYIGSDCYED